MKIMKIIEIINYILLFMGNNKYNFVLFSILIVLFYIDVSCNILDNFLILLNIYKYDHKQINFKKY